MSSCRYIYRCMCIYIYIYAHISLSLYIYIYTEREREMYIYIYIYIQTDIHMCIWVCVCMYIYIYTYTYIHTHTHMYMICMHIICMRISSTTGRRVETVPNLTSARSTKQTENTVFLEDVWYIIWEISWRSLPELPNDMLMNTFKTVQPLQHIHHLSTTCL